ncbi:MAG TPA: NADH-quinone oxidoreductase subunit N [Solirubrobacteraceae bacterium]|nr:NADH-quinone oxidoreductase subunit N [Solirubrobacteraceae bacterium]
MNNALAAHHHVLAAAHLHGPSIGWAGFSPLVALSGGGVVLLLVGLLRPAVVRERILPGLTVLVLLSSIGLAIWRFHHPATLIAGALRLDDLALELDMLFAAAGIAAVLLSWRRRAGADAGHGEYHCLLVWSIFGMQAFVSAQNLVTLFLSIELLSIPLYILCASQTRSEPSLEAGLKYLIIGSVGSATLAFGLALVYGATGSTDFAAIGNALSTGHLTGGVLGDPMVFTGLGLVIVGFAFKASVAPFHQWTPDVYQGAPTPITAFMATATKAAAIGVFLRFFDVAAIGAQDTWAPLLAAVAAITMIVGNVGALGQSSLKRMMGYSGVAQAGYMLSGVVVGSQLGVQAATLYLLAYLAMNMAAFACIVGREAAQPEFGDDISTLAGLGARDPWLAWPMTIGMLALAGIPGTVGFVAKFQLIHALVDGGYTWLGIVLVIGSMISLGYYLRVVAMIWMRRYPMTRTTLAASPAGLAPMAGGSQEADSEPERGDRPPSAHRAALPAEPARPGPGAAASHVVRPPSRRPGQPEIAFVGALSAAAVVFFGIIPSPLFTFAWHAGRAITGIF